MEFFAFACCGGIFLLIIVLIVALIALYNRLVVLRNRVDNAWSQIDVQLQASLRPDSEPGRDGQGLRDARVRDVREGHPGSQHGGRRRQRVAEQGQAENMLTGALKSLFAVAEAYPELKANENFMMLQEELSGHRVEDRVRAAVLQRLGHELQHGDPELPGEPDRRDVRLHGPRVLRGRTGRGSRGAEGLVLGLSDNGDTTAAVSPRGRGGACEWRSDVYDQIASNKSKSVLLIAFFVVLVLAVGWAFRYAFDLGSSG